MYCSNCGGEFRPEITHCPDCAVPLSGEAPDRARRDGLEPLLRATSPEEVADLATRLRSAGIPYVEQSGTALALVEGGGLFGGNRADAWEGRVWVLAGELDAARALLSEPETDEAASAADDWPESAEGETLSDYEQRINRGPQ